jgi:hypothetical protein
MASSRFKWTDLIVVPVGLMGPFLGSWSLNGQDWIHEFFNTPHWLEGTFQYALSILYLGLQFLSPLLLGIVISRWVFYGGRQYLLLRMLLAILVGAGCIYMWWYPLRGFLLPDGS